MAKILIVDDQPAMRLWLRHTLELDQHTILEAADANEALRLLRAAHPDVAFVDVRLPGIDGIKLTSTVTADPDLQSTRVVLLTGSDDPAARQAGLAAGAVQWLLKPAPTARIRAAAAQALAQPPSD